MADFHLESGQPGEHITPRESVEIAGLERKTLRHRAHFLRTSRAARGAQGRLVSHRRPPSWASSTADRESGHRRAR